MKMIFVTSGALVSATPSLRLIQLLVFFFFSHLRLFHGI